MAIAGIIGGISPASTVDYYERIDAAYRARRNGAHPHVLINSVRLDMMTALVSANDPARLTDALVREVDRLAAGGADFAVFSANTPHMVFDGVSARARIPMISIVEATGAAARAAGYRRVGLLGTRFTMEGGFFTRVLDAHGVAMVTPEPADRAYVHDRYMNEFLTGQFLPETRDRFVSIIAALHAQHAIDAVVLGGTEIPLLLRDAAGVPVPYLDTTVIHVDAIVSRLIELESAA